jgi:hypothetical protein
MTCGSTARKTHKRTRPNTQLEEQLPPTTTRLPDKRLEEQLPPTTTGLSEAQFTSNLSADTQLATDNHCPPIAQLACSNGPSTATFLPYNGIPGPPLFVNCVPTFVLCNGIPVLGTPLAYFNWSPTFLPCNGMLGTTLAFDNGPLANKWTPIDAINLKEATGIDEVVNNQDQVANNQQDQLGSKNSVYEENAPWTEWV